MFDAIIAFSLRHRPLIALCTAALVAGGVYAFTRLPIDAVPDITNNQVQILTSAPALSAAEVERYVTVAIEGALKPLPDVVELRSLSQSGLSVVTVVFPDDLDIYVARNRVLESLHDAVEEIPDGVERPELAPVSTGLGEVFRYVVRDTTGRLSQMDLRTVQDWIVRRGLLGTPGLAEVNSLGGFVKQFHVLVRPEALAAYGLTLREVFDAVSKTSGNAGGAYIETGPEHLSVRAVGLATGLDDLRNTAIRSTVTGTPTLLKDVASVEVGSAIRFGSASQDGKGEVVTGITMQIKGANSRIVVDAVKERIEELKEALPDGVVIEPYYDREVLVDGTIATVVRNLIEGALLVIGILLLLLVNVRAGVVVASVIPLSMLFAGIMMVLTKQSGNLMSLGAIDFGLVVDGSLIITENCLRILEGRLRAARGSRLAPEDVRSVVFTGSTEVRKAAQFGELIIIIVYLPILTLQGVEGKLFRPMALTVVYALVGALLLSITYVPMMLSFVMKGSTRIRRSPVVEWMRTLYEPMLRRVLHLRLPMVACAVLMLIGAVFAFNRLGGEFIPRLDEGDIAMHLIRLPSVSLTESQKITMRVEAILLQFPEVRTVVSSTGRAEISTDPMGFELADVFIMLKPRAEWRSGRSKEDLIRDMSQALERVPGAGVQFLQPIEMRMNELIAGARGDVVIKVTGDDYDVMNAAARTITSILRATQGSADVTMSQASGLPQLQIRPDRGAIGRYGLTIDDINNIVSTAVAGAKATEVVEGNRRFDVVVRFAGEMRQSPEAVKGIMVATPSGARVPLAELATVSIEEGPSAINREGGTRFVMIQANVRGRDVQSFVEEARAAISEQVTLPAGYSVLYGGQFKNLEEASQRLAIVVPISLLLIFLLLYQTFRSTRLAVMIFLCVPMAVVGGVGALMVGGLPFSISAGVGFIALFGIAVLNGIVMIAAIRKHREDGLPRHDAVIAGAIERLRPVITTAALAGFGFVPMMLARGAGAEVQRPLATVIIGGIISSTLLTLILLPIVYDWMGEKREKRGDQTGKVNGGDAGGVVTVVTSIVVALVATLPASGQTPITREEVRRRAVAASPELRSADAVVQQRRSEHSATSVLPPLELFGGVDESTSPTLSRDPNARVGLSQGLLLPGAYSARSHLYDALIDEAGAERDARLRDVIHRADMAWLDLVATKWLLATADSAVAVADRFSRLAARRRELGETPGLETIQSMLAQANSRRLRSERAIAYRTSIEALRSLLAAPPTESFTTVDTLTYRPAVQSLSDLEALARERDPRLRASRLAVTVSERNADLVASEHLPSVSIGYSLQTVGGRGGYYGGEVGLALPLWRWLNSGADDAARAQTAVSMTELAAVERDLIAQLRSAYAEQAASHDLIVDIRDHILPMATEAYQVALRLYSEGEAGYLEVLTAQGMLLETQSAFIEALWTAERSRLVVDMLVRADER